MESPFASWMDRFSVESPEQAPEKDPADALMSSLVQKGYAHEDAFESAFIEQGLKLIKIGALRPLKIELSRERDCKNH